MKRAFSVFFFLALTCAGIATDQESDLLIIGTDTIYLQSFPLESLELKERPFGFTTWTAPSTACWRGYTAIWQIVDNKLYLEKIIRCTSDDERGEENIRDLFRRNKVDYQEKGGMILASWVTEDYYVLKSSDIKQPQDKIYLYDSGFKKKKDSENYLSLKIERGEIKSNRIKE